MLGRKLNAVLTSFLLGVALAVVPPGLACAESNNSQTEGIATSEVSGGGINAVSVGAEVYNSDYSVAVGASFQIINAGAGGNTGAYNYGALAIVGEGNTAIGSNAQVVGGEGLKAIGYGAVAGYGNHNVSIGTQAWAGGTPEGLSHNNTALGAEAWAYGGNSVALGAGSVADQPNTVSVGSAGNERRITNVAPGVYGTDAVNMSQLWNTQDKMNRLGATAMAMTGLAPMAYNPKEPTQYSAAIGTYSGNQAIAVGLFHYTKESVMLNAAFGWSADGWDKAGRVGVTWTGGRSTKKEPADNTVHVSNVPGQPAGQNTTAVKEDGIQDRVNRLLQGSSVQADKPASAAPESAAKQVSAEVKAPEKKSVTVPEGGIQDRVNKLLSSHGTQG